MSGSAPGAPANQRKHSIIAVGPDLARAGAGGIEMHPRTEMLDLAVVNDRVWVPIKLGDARSRRLTGNGNSSRYPGSVDSSIRFRPAALARSRRRSASAINASTVGINRAGRSASEASPIDTVTLMR